MIAITIQLRRITYGATALVAVLLLAAVLRLWGIAVGNPVSHPDEVFLLIYPLNFLGGDLNPYSFHKPTLHFYILGLTYLGRFLISAISGSKWDLSQYTTYHYFWDDESLLLCARVVGVAFAVAGVWSVSRLARRLYGETAGLIAGLFLAISVLHVRQSPLAAVDVPMTFWFVGAIWSAVHLFSHGGLRVYLVTGALVGLAAGTKYPGAAAGAAVLCAHLLAGRPLWDRRLWLSGIAAAVVFLACTPYAVLDFDAFRSHFLFQAQHVGGGRGEEGRAWLYHLWISLRHNIGILGLAALPAAVTLQLFRQRRLEVWVVACGFVSFLAAIGWGQLSFMRYALPLAALQVVLVSGLVGSIRTARWKLILVVAIAVEPLYGSVRVAHLLGSTDTRMEARAWIEDNIPAGTTCCNFGGWAGDPQVRTITDHWWRMKTYARSFGSAQLHRQIGFLNAEKPVRPFFKYAVHTGNREMARGDLNALRDAGCVYVILHRHPLSYSRVDSSFARQLPTYGKLVTRWTPAGFGESKPEFDPADAYYIPVAHFGSLRQPGPEIEIWSIDRFAARPPGRQTGNSIFAKGYALWSNTKLEEGALAEASSLIQRGSELAADDTDVHTAGLLQLATARVLLQEKHFGEGLAICLRLAELRPDWFKVYDVLGLLYDQIGDHAAAASAYSRSLSLNPERSLVHNNLAVAFRAQGKPQEATEHWERAIDLDPEYPDAHYNLGTEFFLRGDVARALPLLERAISLQPDSLLAYNTAGKAASAVGDYHKAVEYWEIAVELDPADENLYYNLALTLQRDLKELDRALPYWQRFLQLNPTDLDALRWIARAYSALGRPAEEERWLSRIGELHPDQAKTQ